VLADALGLPGNDTVPVTELLSGARIRESVKVRDSDISITGQTFYRSASEMRTQGLFVVVNQWYAQVFKYL
jgi:hypothetical protein